MVSKGKEGKEGGGVGNGKGVLGVGNLTEELVESSVLEFSVFSHMFSFQFLN